MPTNQNDLAVLSRFWPPEEAQLLANFYQWERRGRGWHIWPAPVGIEPPFRPFFHSVPSAAETEDDGLQHTFLSGLIQRIEGFLRARRLEGDEAPQEQPWEEPTPEAASAAGGYSEIEVFLPEGLDVSPAFAEQFLISLNYCRHPIALEFVGTADAIHVQLSCHDDDLYQVRQSLAAHFPSAARKEQRTFLSEAWEAARGTERLFVDFGLSREFMIPLQTAKGFSVDPLIPLAGALESLEEGEVAAFQILFKPVRHPWAESILRAVSDGQGGAFFSEQPGTLKSAQRKIARPLYACLMRLAVKSPSGERVWTVARAMGGALAQLADPAGNELIPLENDGESYDDDLHERAFLERQSQRGGMILNSDELISLMHLPSASVRSKKLRRLIKRTRPAPDLARGHSICLGINDHEGQQREVTLSSDQRVKHAYLVGASGTGKSTLLLNMILQDAEQGTGFAVLDPHGDLIDQILERLPENRHADVVLLDPADAEFPIGFNILSAHSETEKLLLSSDLVAVFRRLSTSWGDQMTSVLGNGILAFLESSRGGTLADLRRFLVEKEYRQEFLKTVGDSEVVYYWQKEFPLLTGKPQAPLLTRLDTFLRPKLIRHMVAQKENRLDFAEIMNGGKIFLARLAQGAIGEENAYLLGSLLVSKFHQTTLSRQETAEAERRPFFLYVDEFHNFITPSMTQILTGARKFRLGLVLAHHELRQLGGRDSEIGSAVLSNPYTRICFRLGDQDAARLADGFSFFEAKDLQNLGIGEAICRIERAEYDFNLRAPQPDPIDREAARERTARVIAHSRERYGTPREVVEAALELKAAKPAEAGEESAERSKADDKARTVNAEEPDPGARSAEQRTSAGATADSSIKETSPVYEASAQPKLRPEAPSDLMLGVGGPAHKNLQEKIKMWAEGMGWKGEIEKSISGGEGKIDVFLEKAKRTIACEICFTTSAEHEVGNIEKCLKAGCEIVACIATEERQLRKIEAAAAKRLSPPHFEKVRFFTPENLFGFITEMEAQFAAGERRVRGFRVKVKYHPLGESEQKKKMETISKAVVDSHQARKQPGTSEGPKKRRPQRPPPSAKE